MSKEFWTRDNLVVLCQLFELKPVLWNIQDNDYKNKYKRKDALDSIAQELGINNVEEVKKKIDSILVQYRREKKVLVTTSGMGTGEKKKPWWGMQYLKFLADKTTPRPTFSNCAMSDSVTEGYTLNEESTGESNSASGATSEGQSSAATSKTNTPAPPKRSKRMHKSAQQEEAYNIMKECYDGLKTSVVDEHSVYAQHLANRMRQIKDRKRLCLLKHDIEQLIFKAEIDEIDCSEENEQRTEETSGMEQQKKHTRTPFEKEIAPKTSTLPAVEASLSAVEKQDFNYCFFTDSDQSYTDL